jgi:hypothetical protein
MSFTQGVTNFNPGNNPFNKPNSSFTSGITPNMNTGMTSNLTSSFNPTSNVNSNPFGSTTNPLGTNPLTTGLSTSVTTNPLHKPTSTFNQGFSANLSTQGAGPFNLNPQGTTNILGNTNLNKGIGGIAQPMTSFTNTLVTNPLSTSNQNILNINKPGGSAINPILNFPQFQVNYNQFNQNMNQSNKVLTINPNNTLRYARFSTFGDQLVKMITNIELKFRNNEILLDTAETESKGLIEYYKSVTSEGVKLYKYSKLISAKTNKILQILKDFKISIAEQQKFYEKSLKTFNVMVNSPSIKIPVPGDYFVSLVKELEERAALQMEQLSDFEAIINKEKDNNDEDYSDNVESIINRLYDSLISLAGEIAESTEFLNYVKRSYSEYLSIEYGIKESDIEARYRNYILNDRAFSIFKS